MEPVENQKPRKQSIQTDRVTIGMTEAAKLERWILQVNEFLNGYTTISKSEIVNFLITSHKEELSSREIKRLTHANYNPVKHMQWLTKQLKEALEVNDTDRVSKIQIELRNVELPSSKTHNDSIASENEFKGDKKERKRSKITSEKTDISEGKQGALSVPNLTKNVDVSEEKSYGKEAL